MQNELLLRISDSILDERDWTVAALAIADDRVVSKRIAREGAMSGVTGSPEVGATLADVAKWTEYDSTGRHPETYHEVQVNGAWQDYVSVEELRAELNARARRHEDDHIDELAGRRGC